MRRSSATATEHPAEGTGRARRRRRKSRIAGSGWRGRRGSRGLPAATLGLCDRGLCGCRRVRRRIASASFLRSIILLTMFLPEKDILLLSTTKSTHRKGTPLTHEKRQTWKTHDMFVVTV